MLEVTVIVWGIVQSVLKKKKKGCGGKDLPSQFTPPDTTKLFRRVVSGGVN